MLTTRESSLRKIGIFHVFLVSHAVPNFRLGDENFRKKHVPMSQKALLINSIHQKQKFKKSFEKVKSC